MATKEVKRVTPAEPKAVLAFISAAFVAFLGSIPQQDVFQRAMSARNEETAMTASILGGILYFVIASIPVFLIMAAVLVLVY